MSRATSRFRRLALAALLGAIAMLPAAAVVPPDWSPRPGEFVWRPEIAPRGPMLVVVHLPLQQLHVYRNGVRIGASTISSGKPGHETPVGVFTILQKKAEHYSNLYDNAPMPFMQRLTWDGIALHAGRLPGHPASHGCVRLPDAFARALFGVTRTGDTVIVTRGAAAPGVVAGVDPPLSASALPPLDAPAFWAPERAPSGPVSIVISTRDRRLVGTRNGVRIGEAALHVAEGLVLGTRAFVVLDGAGEGANPVVPDRRARRWLEVGVDPAATSVGDALRSGALAVPAGLARPIDDLLHPGASVVITDAPLGDGGRRVPIEVESEPRRDAPAAIPD